jgi:maleate cis-trans isomerase
VKLEALLAILLAWGSTVGGAGWWAYGLGKDHEIASQAREDKAADTAARVASDAAAKAISGIEVQRVEITQPTITKVRETVRYRECVHEPGVLRNINAALTGRAEPAGGGQLPAASAPGR